VDNGADGVGAECCLLGGGTGEKDGFVGVGAECCLFGVGGGGEVG